MATNYLDKIGLERLWSKIKSALPTKVSDLTNDEQYQTLTQVNALIQNAIDSFGDGDTAEYGIPLAAPTASTMTDTTRIYVYTGTETGYTKGNWYYYDGENWLSGGSYNSASLDHIILGLNNETLIIS